MITHSGPHVGFYFSIHDLGKLLLLQRFFVLNTQYGIVRESNNSEVK